MGTIIEGVDYADSVPNAAKLAAAGKAFAVRYGGPGRTSKQLTAGELAALRAAGVFVVANAEGAADGFTGTSAGFTWASEALDHFASLGMPTDRPIYFSADFDAGAADWAGIDAALRGAAGVLGAHRVGVYGSYATVEHCKAARTASWFWQTYAWSGGKAPAAGTHLYQYKNGQTVAGADVDLVRALTDDFGQWGANVLTQADRDWITAQLPTAEDIAAAVLAASVTVGDEQWKAGSAIGYTAREAYLIDKALPAVVPTAADTAAAVVAALDAREVPPTA